MKRTICLSVMVLGLAVSAFAQGKRIPTFGQYPAKIERATARSIDFRNSPGAKSFRTRLTYALGRGVNFAGRYIVTGWGCGTGCVYGAIIDARTGRAYFPAPLHGLATGVVADEYVDKPVQHVRNSRLLIISGTPGTELEKGLDLPAGTHYYEWKNNRLRLIRSVPYEKN